MKYVAWLLLAASSMAFAVEPKLTVSVHEPKVRHWQNGFVGSYAVPVGPAFTFRWTFESGPSVPTIENPTQKSTRIFFPQKVPGAYVFRQTVTDPADGKSASAAVRITMLNPDGTDPGAEPPTEGYACAKPSSTVVPSIATKEQWDARYDAQWGNRMPEPYSRGSLDFAWAGHYWLRAYVSMARTYGDTKYLDRAVTMIDYWLAHTDGPHGWGVREPGFQMAQMMLDTGMISHAIGIFNYVVWSDPRFTAYRARAAAYTNRIEAFLRTYDYQWVENAPYPGSPGNWRYASCAQGLCRTDQLLMFNQAATVAKAMLLIDRTRRLMGQTPDAGLTYKAGKVADYFKTFARDQGGAYVWKYSGAVPRPDQVEDIDHGHIDVGFLISAYKFEVGNLTAGDMKKLAGTFARVLGGEAGPADVSRNVDGTGVPDMTWRRLPSGYDWIDLVEYDHALLDKVVSVWNKWMPWPGNARYYLGWAEIQRVRACKAQL